MNTIVGFFIYAAIFRLAIIAAGIVSIVLGYKLFVHGAVFEGGTDVDAQTDRFKLILRNAAPGTVFAAFGAVIISVMLFQGNPEFFRKEMQQLIPSSDIKTGTPSSSSISQPETQETVSITQTRSGNDNEDVSTDKEWDKLDKPNITLSEAAGPLSNIARIWQQEKRIGEAVAMARLAVFYGAEKDKAKYLALLGETFFENGDTQKAVIAMQKAVERDPLYRAALARMQEGLEGKKE